MATYRLLTFRDESVLMSNLYQMSTQDVVYVLLTQHALKRATNRNRLDLPPDPDGICKFLNTEVCEGYIGKLRRGFVIDSTRPPIKALLYPAPLIGQRSYLATTLIRREGSDEFVLEGESPVRIIWDFDKSPRNGKFRRRPPQLAFLD